MSVGRIRTSPRLVRIQTSNFFTRTVVRARHRVIMMLLHAVTCTVTLDDMPGGLLDMSFLAGGMDMHACTVESATTSTQRRGIYRGAALYMGVPSSE